MQYILIDRQRKENCINYISSLTDYDKYEVVIKPYKKNRSTSQNRTMWMWYNELSKHTGHTPEELHEQMKVSVLGVDRRVVHGQALIIPKSTTGLSTKDMSEFMRAIEELARELQVRLPIPDDYKYAMGRE